VSSFIERVCNGVIPLAVLGGCVDLTRKLLEKGFDVEGEYQNESALHCAVLNNQADMIGKSSNSARDAGRHLPRPQE
jgi:hypothetical protein